MYTICNEGLIKDAGDDRALMGSVSLRYSHLTVSLIILPLDELESLYVEEFIYANHFRIPIQMIFLLSTT